MPIYEYRCRSCLHEFERFQKITDPPESTCPECGGEVDRLVSSTSFTLKGGGWYKDGYSSSSSTSKRGGTKETPKKADKKADKQ